MTPQPPLANAKLPITMRLVGRPVPCPRPRFSRSGHTYYPASYTAWVSEALQQVLRPVDTATTVTEDLIVAIEVIGETPKKTTRSTPHGDVDNFAKSILDLLTKAQVWKDDNQIQRLTVAKRWAQPGEDPGYLVTISKV